MQQKKTPHPPPAHLVAAARRCTQRTLQLRDTEKDERQDKKRRTEEVGEDSFDAEIQEQKSLEGVIRVFLKHDIWERDHSSRCGEVALFNITSQEFECSREQCYKHHILPSGAEV